MAARGVVSPHARRALIDAAAQVVEESGAESVSVRAIAAQAGVATGLLYKYFTGLDDLLVALVVDRFDAMAAEGRVLQGLVGTGTVADNLTKFGHQLAGGPSQPLGHLMANQPGLAARARDALGTPHAPGHEQLEQAVADYLRAEQHLGRLTPNADAYGASLLLVSGWHRLIFDRAQDPTVVAAQIEQLVHTLMNGLLSRD